MTEHAALADAIVEPAFARSFGAPSDRTRDEHLASCTECRVTLAGVRGDAARIAAFQAGEPSPWVARAVLRATRPATRWGAIERMLVYAVLAIGLAGVGVAGVGSFLDLGKTVEPAPTSAITTLDAALAGKSLVWKSESVVLAADQLVILANGAAIRPPARDLKVVGDPGGDPTTGAGPTIELAWIDGGVEQRLSIDLATDGSQWRVREIRVYDNARPNPDWVDLPVPAIGAPLGMAAVGDLDIGATGRAGPVELRITGLVLSANEPRPVNPPNAVVGGKPALVDPFAPGGALHCSGILQLSPPDAERALAGRGMRAIWDVRSGTDPKTLREQETAPAAGLISGSMAGKAGWPVIVVEDPARPLASAAPVPADCPPPPSG